MSEEEYPKEVPPQFFSDNSGMAQWDQIHAEAITMLRDCESFHLVVEKGGKLIATAGIQGNPERTIEFLYAVGLFAQDNISGAMGQMEKNDGDSDDE